MLIKMDEDQVRRLLPTFEKIDDFIRRFRGYDAIFNFFLRWCKLNFVLTHFTGFFACCW